MKFDPTVSIYLAVGATDMRKAINGLSILVQQQMGADPFGGHYFAFSNRRRTLIKVLYWDRTGFCLWQKRLERHRFIWPRTAQDVMNIDSTQWEWLLAGLDMSQAHEKLEYRTVI
jgi:transposase